MRSAPGIRQPEGGSPPQMHGEWTVYELRDVICSAAWGKKKVLLQELVVNINLVTEIDLIKSNNGFIV